jgi:hypothetical protein
MVDDQAFSPKPVEGVWAQAGEKAALASLLCGRFSLDGSSIASRG